MMRPISLQDGAFSYRGFLKRRRVPQTWASEDGQFCSPQMKPTP